PDKTRFASPMKQLASVVEFGSASEEQRRVFGNAPIPAHLDVMHDIARDLPSARPTSRFYGPPAMSHARPAGSASRARRPRSLAQMSPAELYDDEVTRRIGE